MGAWWGRGGVAGAAAMAMAMTWMKRASRLELYLPQVLKAVSMVDE